MLRYIWHWVVFDSSLNFDSLANKIAKIFLQKSQRVYISWNYSRYKQRLVCRNNFHVSFAYLSYSVINVWNEKLMLIVFNFHIYRVTQKKRAPILSLKVYTGPVFFGSPVKSVAKRVKAPFLWRLWFMAWSWFNTYTSRIVATLDKELYDNYLCLTISKKQQIWKEATGNLGYRQLLCEWGFVRNMAQSSLSRDMRINMEQNKI